MVIVKTGYSEPKLHDGGGLLSKEWYVGFRHTCPTCMVRKPYQHRMGINNLKSVGGRRLEAKAVSNILRKALESGWNPHHEEIIAFLKRQVETSTPVGAGIHIGGMAFNRAIDYALNAKKDSLAGKSFSGFTTCKEYAQRAAVKLGYYDIPIRDIRRAHIKELLAQIVRDRQAEYDADPKRWKGRKVTGNFYNKYKGYLGCILSELVEYEAMEYNPCDKIKNKPKVTTNIHRHATRAERDLIKSTLQLKCPQLYYYLLVEHGTGIRPKEIFYLRICDIDWFTQSFNVSCFDEATKDRESRMVPIPNTLMKHLKDMHLEKHNPLHYIFSNAFRPGPERKRSDYAGRIWKEIVKDGLGLNVSLYSFKGLGGEDKRNAGVALHAVSSQYGHSNLSTTMAYTYNERERMDQEIREKTPEL